MRYVIGFGLFPVCLFGITWLGRVLNLLFGTNVGAIDAIAEGTEDAADAQDELANATDRAGKAAKGALASFDKLNVLSQPAPTSGGGGGTDLGLPEEEEDGGALGKIGKALDELEIKIAAFKQNLLAFFAPLQEPFNRLKEAFLTLGATIGTGLGLGLDKHLTAIFQLAWSRCSASGIRPGYCCSQFAQRSLDCGFASFLMALGKRIAANREMGG